MSVASGLWAAHLARQHGCCWIMEGVQCGLWCGHDGDHLPYTPGEYLMPPLLNPLDMLKQMRTPWWRLHCPMCGAPSHGWEADDWTFDGGDYYWTGTICRYEPCGCEAREDVQQ